LKRKLPIPLLILIDLVLLGGALCVYALFHHVIPRVEVDLSQQPGSQPKPPTQIGAPADTDPEATSPIDTDPIGPADTDPIDTAGTQTSPPVTTEPAETDPPGPFTQGEIISTETLYQSEDICVTLTKYSRPYAGEGQPPSVFYVQDVRVRYVENLKTAFAKDQYGKNITEWTKTIADRKGAVAALSGDFYGLRSTGVVIRDGVLYRDKASGDDQEDLVIWPDGSFEIITEGTVSAQSLADAGALQVYSFGPALIENGEISVGLNDEVGRAKASNPRTAVCEIEPLHYLFVVSDGRTDESEGLSLYELAEFLETFNVKTAYNLDGGGSSTMVFMGELVNNPTTGGNRVSERSVSDALCIGY